MSVKVPGLSSGAIARDRDASARRQVLDARAILGTFPDMQDEPQCSVEAAAVFLDVSTKTVRRRIKDGELPAYRVGRQLRIAPDDLRGYRQRTAVVASTMQPLPVVEDWKRELLDVTYQDPAA
jgi:excisionase family DNA binding protein